MHFIRKMKKGQDEVSLKFCSDRYWWPGVVGSRSPSLSFSDPELLSNRPKHTMYSEKLLRKSPTFAGTQTFEFETIALLFLSIYVKIKRFFIYAA